MPITAVRVSRPSTSQGLSAVPDDSEIHPLIESERVAVVGVNGTPRYKSLLRAEPEDSPALNDRKRTTPSSRASAFAKGGVVKGRVYELRPRMERDGSASSLVDWGVATMGDDSDDLADVSARARTGRLGSSSQVRLSSSGRMSPGSANPGGMSPLGTR